MYRACIFDMDGTILNTLASIAGFANEALEKYHCPPIDLETYRYLVGNGADQLIRGMLRTVKPDFSEQDVRSLRGIYDACYAADPLRGVEQYDGMPELLAELNRRGIPLAVLSNKPDDMVHAVADRLSPGVFRIVRGQTPDIPRKPSPEGALRIAEELGVKPCECLYLGDTDVDMKTGRAAGMETIGVLWGFRTRDELERSGADQIARIPADVLKILDAAM